MLRPLRDNLYIIPMKDPEKIGSIYVPESAKQRPDQGIVKYRGPLTTGEIKIGDHVLFGGWDGSQIVTQDDGLLYVLPESFIQAVFEDEKPAYLFTKEQVIDMFDKARGLATYTPKDGQLSLTAYINAIHERFVAELDSHFAQELSF